MQRAMRQLAELKRLDLRGIWAKESSEFTPWLAENIEGTPTADRDGMDTALLG